MNTIRDYSSHAERMYEDELEERARNKLIGNLETEIRNYEQKMAVLGVQSSEPAATPVPVIETEKGPQTNSGQQNLGTGGQYLVVITDTPTGFLRVRKTPNGTEIAKVNIGDKMPFLEDVEGWYKVQLVDGKTGWVSKEYSSKE